MPIMSTNFAWKHEYDVKLWRHKKRTPNTNDHHMPLKPPLWKFSAYATASLTCLCPVRELNIPQVFYIYGFVPAPPFHLMSTSRLWPFRATQSEASERQHVYATDKTTTFPKRSAWMPIPGWSSSHRLPRFLAQPRAGLRTALPRLWWGLFCKRSPSWNRKLRFSMALHKAKKKTLAAWASRPAQS